MQMYLVIDGVDDGLGHSDWGRMWEIRIGEKNEARWWLPVYEMLVENVACNKWSCDRRLNIDLSIA